MNKIIFKISNTNLSVSIYSKDTPKEDLNKTNIIDTKELIFSDEYIIENLDLVSSFINVIILKRKVTKITIKDYNIIPICLDIINNIPSITELIIKVNKQLNYEIFMKLLSNKTLKKLDCYDIPKYLLERLDHNTKIEINIRSEIFFISDFMSSNNLNTYSDIFYKKSIVINSFKEEDKNDLITFFSINKYLNIIDVENFTKEKFLYIITIIFQKKLSNIKIILHDKKEMNEIYNEIAKIKKNYEKRLKENNITFKIKYSDEYKSKNLFKQINLNIIKISLIGLIIFASLIIGINYFKNYQDDKKSQIIENDLKKILIDTNTLDNNENDIEYIDFTEDDTTTTTTTIYDIKYEKIFNKLLEINDDTIGWLTVNSTKIDYPVVQSSDNDYYLNKDYYAQKNRHGWIFADYRNNFDELNTNTIIYGHNLANQSMFGTLRYALNPSWYKKTSNQIITFNTKQSNMNWQIFSIYTIPSTTDYLYTDFGNDEDFNNFIKLITERSIYNFNININRDDKILTLSTCSNGSAERLVVHAKLIK